jgi:hypothetical protein
MTYCSNKPHFPRIPSLRTIGCRAKEECRKALVLSSTNRKATLICPPARLGAGIFDQKYFCYGEIDLKSFWNYDGIFDRHINKIQSLFKSI